MDQRLQDGPAKSLHSHQGVTTAACERPGPLLRRASDLGCSSTPFVVLICALMTVPFFFATIPPLTDLPGHMGGSAVAAYSDDPVFAKLMAFHWRLVPNLGTDLVVAALQGLLGLTRAYRFAAAIIPPLLAAGILLVARALNPRGAAAAPWALVFVYSYLLNYGFLNYMLGAALSLLCFAAWMLLDERPRLREGATWIAVPLLFLCHVVAGCLFVLFVGSREFALLRGRWRAGEFLRRVRPLLSSVVIIVLWRLDAQSFAGSNRFSFSAKYNAVLMLLRDQNLLLDVGSLILALAVFAVGWRRHARPHPAVMPALLVLIVLFLATPFSLSGSSYADARLLPLVPMLAFATQDWSGVDPRLARRVAACGFAVLAVRLAVTTAGFAAYDARYSAELAALAHIPEHSRVIVLNKRDCDFRLFWRADRLDHLGDLAIAYRRAWTNSQWDVDGAHLLQILYRPSPRFYDDPSQYVWPSRCGGVEKKRPTLRDALAAIPFDGIDVLWLIDASLPTGYRNARLSPQWQGEDSVLYAVLPAAQAPR
jgi:hypothetical protein